jgi:hypothetical protein
MTLCRVDESVAPVEVPGPSTGASFGELVIYDGARELGVQLKPSPWNRFNAWQLRDFGVELREVTPAWPSIAKVVSNWFAADVGLQFSSPDAVQRGLDLFQLQ